MKSPQLVLSVLAGLVLLVTACGPQTTPTTAPPATQPAALVPVTGAAMVDLGKNDTLGSFLVDDKGMTLYLYTKDTPNTSNCYDKCATAWPPLLTTGTPVAGDGVDASMFGTTTRKDGSTQVTYNGWPLYYYAKDKAAGDVTDRMLAAYGMLFLQPENKSKPHKFFKPADSWMPCTRQVHGILLSMPAIVDMLQSFHGHALSRCDSHREFGGHVPTCHPRFAVRRV